MQNPRSLAAMTSFLILWNPDLTGQGTHQMAVLPLTHLLEMQTYCSFNISGTPFAFCRSKCYSTNFVFQQASTFSFGEANIDSAPKTAKKITGKKFNDLSGNDIFKGDAPPASAEKHLSTAKLKEITGSNIFADGKEPSCERPSGNRKPPGGESSIALV